VWTEVYRFLELRSIYLVAIAEAKIAWFLRVAGQLKIHFFNVRNDGVIGLI